MYVYIYTSTHQYIRTYTGKAVDAHCCICMLERGLYHRGSIYLVYIYIYIYIYTYILVYMCIHICIHTSAHAHIHRERG